MGRPSGWSLYPVLRDSGSSVGGRAGSVFALMSRLEFDDRKVDATPGAANGDQHPGRAATAGIDPSDPGARHAGPAQAGGRVCEVSADIDCNE